MYDNEGCERTGAPLTAARHDHGLSTEIGRGTDANGNELSGQKRRLARMRREQSRGQWRSKAERNLAHGLGKVRRLTSALDLFESIRNRVCQLFRSVQNEDLLRGRSIEAIAAASVYGACRCNGLPRLVSEVNEMARITESRVTNAYKALNEELGLPAEPVSPYVFVPRLSLELRVSGGDPMAGPNARGAGRGARRHDGCLSGRVRSGLSLQGRSRGGTMADAIRGRGRGERLEGNCPGAPRYIGGTGRLTQSTVSPSVLHIVLSTLRFKHEDEPCSL